MPRPKKPANPFRYFNSSPEIIRLVVVMYVRFSLSLRNVEALVAARGGGICQETVRHRWTRFAPMFAADVKRKRTSRMPCTNWALKIAVKLEGSIKIDLKTAT